MRKRKEPTLNRRGFLKGGSCWRSGPGDEDHTSKRTTGRTEGLPELR